MASCFAFRELFVLKGDGNIYWHANLSSLFQNNFIRYLFFFFLTKFGKNIYNDCLWYFLFLLLLLLLLAVTCILFVKLRSECDIDSVPVLLMWKRFSSQIQEFLTVHDKVGFLQSLLYKIWTGPSSKKHAIFNRFLRQ